MKLELFLKRKCRFDDINSFLKVLFHELNLLNVSSLKMLHEENFQAIIRDYIVENVSVFKDHKSSIRYTELSDEEYVAAKKDLPLSKLLRPGDYATLIDIGQTVSKKLEDNPNYFSTISSRSPIPEAPEKDKWVLSRFFLVNLLKIELFVFDRLKDLVTQRFLKRKLPATFDLQLKEDEQPIVVCKMTNCNKKIVLQKRGRSFHFSNFDRHLNDVHIKKKKKPLESTRECQNLELSNDSESINDSELSNFSHDNSSNFEQNDLGHSEQDNTSKIEQISESAENSIEPSFEAVFFNESDAIDE